MENKIASKDETSILDELIEAFNKKAKENEERSKKLSNILFSKHKKSSPAISKSKLNVNYYQPKQVVIKNIGNLKSLHLKNALDYAISHSLTPCVSNDGSTIFNANEIMELWKNDFKNKSNNANLALHLVFSIDEFGSKENMEILLNSVKETMGVVFNEYKYVIALHSHQNKPHCHIIINKKNIFNSKMLHFKSKDEIKDFYFNLREHFKCSLNANSRGKFRYENLYSHQKDFYKNKILELEELDSKLDKISNVDFESYYIKAIEAIIKKQTLLESKISLHSKTLKELIISKNDIESHSSLESLLQDSSYKIICDKIKVFANDIKKFNNEIKKLESSKDSTKQFNLFLKDRLKDSTILAKSEYCLKSLLKINPHISKDLSNNLLALKTKINKLKAEDKEMLGNLVEQSSINIKQSYVKTSNYKLFPMLENLKLYLSLNNLESSDKDEIKNLTSKVESLINRRIDYLLLKLEANIVDERDKEIDYKKDSRKYLLKELKYSLSYATKEQTDKFNNLVNNLLKIYGKDNKTIKPSNVDINQAKDLKSLESSLDIKSNANNLESKLDSTLNAKDLNTKAVSKTQTQIKQSSKSLDSKNIKDNMEI